MGCWFSTRRCEGKAADPPTRRGCPKSAFGTTPLRIVAQDHRHAVESWLVPVPKLEVCSAADEKTKAIGARKGVLPMNFPGLSPQFRLQRLEPPRGRVSLVLDTDAYNEVDDQFALVHALLSPEKLRVEAVYAAPFHNCRSAGPADGMERSFEEILRLLELLDHPAAGLVYRGATSFL